MRQKLEFLLNPEDLLLKMGYHPFYLVLRNQYKICLLYTSLDLLMQVYGAINSDTAVKEAGLTALNGLIQRPELLTASAQAALRQGVRDALMKCINVQELSLIHILSSISPKSPLPAV